MSFANKHKEDIDSLFSMLRVHVKTKYEIDVDDIESIKDKSRKAHIDYFIKIMMIIIG